MQVHTHNKGGEKMKKPFFKEITKKYPTKYTNTMHKINKLTLITLDISLLLWTLSVFLIKIRPYANLLLIIEAVLVIISIIFIILEANIRRNGNPKGKYLNYM